ncbi:MAG: hypothetical protein GDA44_04415 [Prochloron sp. SP5CPC1]|nr:hypothetical protein [Candidatus Paraprochloron terpiosi SP5CPC1]
MVQTYVTPSQLSRITKIVGELFQENSRYREKLDPEEMIQYLAEVFGEFAPGEMEQIEYDDLKKRMNSILVVESVAGCLNDLTPEEMRIFDEAVEGR